MKLAKWMTILLVLFLLGCSKLTMENYNKITMGMNYDEVTNLIGKPEKCDDVMGVRNCRWSSGDRVVNVSFAGDKVLFFSSENLQ